MPNQASLPSPFAELHLDPDAHDPLWRQLLLQLEQLLANGTLSEGTSLPPERELALALGVSRVTVKRSYDELRRANRLAGRGRAGSVLKAPPQVSPSLGRLKGFTEEMRELGMQASSRLEFCEMVSDRQTATLFSRPSHAPFLHVGRVRLGNGVPMSRELAWYDLTLAPALRNWAGHDSAYAWLHEHCRLTLTHAEQSIEAVQSSEAEMAAFGYSQPQPCLLLKRRTYTADGALVEYVEGTFRGDAYAYRLNLTL